MTMRKYALTPWQIKDMDNYPGLKYIVDARGSRIAEVSKRHARLFAAAPDLLAALQAVADYWDGGPYYNKPYEVETLFRAAIAKATKGE